jgi:hypothetical protein
VRNRHFHAGTFAHEPLLCWLADPQWRTELTDAHVVLACHESTYTTVSLPGITEYPIISACQPHQ